MSATSEHAMERDAPGGTFRFAPSPTGYLHLGHALSALTGHRLARARGGRFLLRIEDIDLERMRPEFVTAIEEDLAWLGLDWDGPVMRQSEQFGVYQAAVERLAAAGLLYPCYATRTEIALASAAAGLGRDPDGAPLHPGRGHDFGPDVTIRRAELGQRPALRLDMQRALAQARLKLKGAPLVFHEWDGAASTRMITCRPERWGDVVLVRKSVPTSYHLAVVVDDARQGVTHVTRGMDLFAATDLHRLLQVLLDLPAPLYHHHRLILAEDGNKLSKSAGSRSLRDLRAAGVSPEEIRSQLSG